MKIKIVGLEPSQGFKQGWLKGIILEGKPKLALVYELVEYNNQTDQQRKLFNPLVRLYYNSGVYSYPADNWLGLRDQIKKNLGAGFERYEYADKDYQIIRVDKLEEVPDYVLKDFTEGNKQRIKGVLKSMADYTRKQMIDVVENLIREMLQTDVMHTRQAKKFQEILEEIGFKE